MSTATTPTENSVAMDNQLQRFDQALSALETATSFAISIYQNDIFQIAETLIATERGMLALLDRAPLFDKTKVFNGGPWEDPGKLQPPLVRGSLQSRGVYPVVETLSELRMLSIACGKTSHESVTQKEAIQFLNDVMALNLDLVFPGNTEQERVEAGVFYDSNVLLFNLIAEKIGLGYLGETVISEIEQICSQRPIRVNRVRKMLMMIEQIPEEKTEIHHHERLCLYLEAVNGPTKLSRENENWANYRESLTAADTSTLQKEAEDFYTSMQTTGLVCEKHAILLRYLAKRYPEYIRDALGLSDAGWAEFEKQQEFAVQLIKVAIQPSTSQSVYGFRNLLENGLLSRQEVEVGLRKLVNLDLQSHVRQNLLAQRRWHDGVSPNAILVAGVISVLGQPLGVGQGNNPTCQAARGISMWALHAAGYLIEMLVSAARDGFLEMPFEGENIRTHEESTRPAGDLDLDLDPVSIVLVPHLDAMYGEMMKRVVTRNEDSHKWVNPALYGRWVPNGFATVFSDLAQTTVGGYEDFLRKFFATHHPSFNDGLPLMYPNPIGICVTNSHGAYLGPHAITLLRISDDPDGVLRAYFFNPNNEGRQDWGFGVKASVRDKGENEGESSLPFNQFASRIYAFHYNPYEEGDGYAVPKPVIEEIERAARESWGATFRWEG